MASDAIDAATRHAGLTPGASHPAAILGAPPESNARLEANILAGKPLDSGDAREITRLVREEIARIKSAVPNRR